MISSPWWWMRPRRDPAAQAKEKAAPLRSLWAEGCFLLRAPVLVLSATAMLSPTIMFSGSRCHAVAASLPCPGSYPTGVAFSLSGSRTASEAGVPGSPGSEPVRSSCSSSDLPFLMLVVNLGREPLPVYAAQAGGGYRDGRTVENRRFLVPWLNCNPNRRQLYLKKPETYCKPPAFRV